MRKSVTNPAKTTNHTAIKYAFYWYLVLGITDIIHHLHAAFFLGQINALHAAILGIILVPAAIYSFLKYSGNGAAIFFRFFIGIALLAIMIPGIYHGGWEHLVNVLSHFRIDSPHTEISSLFPVSGFHLWFYELTGILEFIVAIPCLYYIGRSFLSNT